MNFENSINVTKNIDRNEPSFDAFLEEIKEIKKSGHKFTCVEAEEKAEEILKLANFYNINTATPIVKLVKRFGINIFKANLPEDLCGEISINGDTKEIYGYDSVILLNQREELFHQRFVIAHELAHYLFDYYGEEEYDSNKKYYNQYKKNDHFSLEEKLANRFAAALLMPQELFMEQYNKAILEGSTRLFVVKYLSGFFETTVESIERRIAEVVA